MEKGKRLRGNTFIESVPDETEESELLEVVSVLLTPRVSAADVVANHGCHI